MTISSLLIFAGHDTTTNSLSRILHQLSIYPGVQSRVRDEIIAAQKEHGDLDYDALMALPVLDAVCRETLRVFPPVAWVNRVYVLRSDRLLSSSLLTDLHVNNLA